MRKFYFFFLIPLIFLLASCDDDDLKADIPGYLSIEDVSVFVEPNQGSADDRITDVNVFINDQSLGFFELPAKIPILLTGEVNLKIRPVIRINGMSNQKEDYPFYTTFDTTLTISPLDDIKINPQIAYFPLTNFTEPWSGEDFESGINFIYHPLSDTIFERTLEPNDAFEGASGIAILEADQEFFEARTPTFSRIPRDGTDVYMELNFKSTHDFVIVVYANNQTLQQVIIFVRGRATWSKIYVKLGSVFAQLAGSQNFNIAIGMQKARGETARLLIDNVKLLSFQ